MSTRVAAQKLRVFWFKNIHSISPPAICFSYRTSRVAYRRRFVRNEAWSTCHDALELLQDGRGKDLRLRQGVLPPRIFLIQHDRVSVGVALESSQNTTIPEITSRNPCIAAPTAWEDDTNNSYHMPRTGTTRSWSGWQRLRKSIARLVEQVVVPAISMARALADTIYVLDRDFLVSNPSETSVAHEVVIVFALCSGTAGAPSFLSSHPFSCDAEKSRGAARFQLDQDEACEFVPSNAWIDTRPYCCAQHLEESALETPKIPLGMPFRSSGD
ncbi:uncharacterized protein MYCFIDRAFT_179056 [Pseudocercospora fijiensis CIRAD86]|uniref:Uncharacterized protein n=1 Tax=Pseudocercospora fijiensis (strain CIRAD86) TaxID=383855 RepID=M3AJ79_PSEFD|nr:uncharacterized protein MYCFIDRAFT_179056 [Pseudocercospora fijiensis CIRAD86]EME77542.1 hypothetical protein MYCFIDRAFT_179056 [Pseudocercospora fijiensis CIRAD86]